MTANQSPSTLIWSGDNGGAIGGFLGNMILGILDKPLGMVLFFVSSLFAFFFTFSVSPKILLKFLPKKTSDDSEQLSDSSERSEELAAESGKKFVTDLGVLKRRFNKTHTTGFVLKEGVPVEHSSGHKQEEPQKPLSSLKNTAQKLSSSEQHEALTTTNDPDWQAPGVELLNQKQDKADAGDVKANAQMIEDTFRHFNIDVEMTGANIGPRVTQYTLSPPANVKLNKIVALENNLALNLAATSIRIEAPIPGQRAVGIEVPNKRAATVRTASIFQSPEWRNQAADLPIAIGRDIAVSRLCSPGKDASHANCWSNWLGKVSYDQRSSYVAIV